MRALRQASLTIALLLISLVALNVLRLARAPAQVGPGAVLSGSSAGTWTAMARSTLPTR